MKSILYKPIMNQIQRLSYFKKNKNKPKLSAHADFLSFLIEISMLALIYILIEMPNIFKGKGLIESIIVYFTEGLYFVFTTITTVGYGDRSPTTATGMLFVIMGLFLYGATRIITVISGYSHAESEVRTMKSNGRLFEEKNGHVIVYCDAESLYVDNFKWIERFVKEMHTSLRFADNEIVFVNHNERFAERFNNFINEKYFEQDNVSHYNTNIDEEDFFNKVSIDNAEQIFIIANTKDTHSDSNALDFAIRIKEETNYEKGVTAEVANDDNRKRMLKLAGVNVVIRPTRAYPCFLVSATIGEGVREVIEELMSRGKDTLEVFDAHKYTFSWGEFLYRASMDGLGTSIAYIDEEYNVDPNPFGYEEIKNCHRVILMIQNMREKDYNELQLKVNAILEDIKK